jgi:hypothetical protein
MREYYQQHFQSDLKRFLPCSDLPYFGHGWDRGCPGLENVMPNHRARFLVCLYFTVLVDQAVYTHFPALYPRFGELTLYPKFCHGLGQSQKNPRDLLDTPVERGLVTGAALAEVIPEGMDLFVDELIDFSGRHLPELEPIDFFQKLLYDPDVQIPLLVPLLEPSVRQYPGWVAYESLRNAVAAKFPTLA